MIFDGDDSDYDSDDGVLKPGEVGTISTVCYTLVISSSDAYDDEPYLVRGPSGRTCWYKASDVVAAAADLRLTTGDRVRLAPVRPEELGPCVGLLLASAWPRPCVVWRGPGSNDRGGGGAGDTERT